MGRLSSLYFANSIGNSLSTDILLAMLLLFDGIRPKVPKTLLTTSIVLIGLLGCASKASKAGLEDLDAFFEEPLPKPDLPSDKNMKEDAPYEGKEAEALKETGTSDPGLAEEDVSDEGASDGSLFAPIDLRVTANVRAMWASYGLGIWMVGDGGLVLRSHNNTFIPGPPSPTTKNLYGVSGLGGEIVVVGEQGTVLVYQDGRFYALPPPGPEDLYGVGLISEEDFYVCGKGGAIYHYQKGQWTREATGITYDLYALSASPAGKVLAAGAYGTLLELQGSHFLQFQIASPATAIRSIWQAPDGRAVAVGTKGTVVLFDGKSWKLQVTNDPADPPRDLYGVTGFSFDEVYAVGSGGVILKFNGKKWALMTVYGPYNGLADLRAVSGLQNPDGSKVLVAAGLGGKALHLVDKTWSDLTLGVTVNLNSATMEKDGTLLIAGDQGVLLRYDGSRLWGIETNIEKDLNSVHGATVVGDSGTVLRVFGDKVEEVEKEVEVDLTDVWDDGEEAFATGVDGTVLVINKGKIEVIDQLKGLPLHGVCRAQGQLFVAGALGRVFVHSGSGFEQVQSDTFSDLWDLWPLSGQKVLAVGDNGIIVVCSQQGCKKVNEEPAVFFYGAGPALEGVLAVGFAGEVRLITEDEEVHDVASKTYRVLYAVAGVGALGESYIVGADGAFFVYRP